MKNWLLSLAALTIAGVVSFGVVYRLNDDAEVSRAARQGDAMAWLHAEFRLSDEQFENIRTAHADYAVECAQHCRAIVRARDRQAAPQEIAALEQVCVTAMTAHFHRVAQMMPPEQGERYLALVLPRIAGYDHREAPSVKLAP